MPDWDNVILGFEGLYDMMKDRDTDGGKMWAGHANGMLQLIPRIRHFEEFKDIEFGIQLGKLVFTRNSELSLFLLSTQHFLCYSLVKQMFSWRPVHEL